MGDVYGVVGVGMGGRVVEILTVELIYLVSEG
jgi:hypothetical protein